jgi:hypothetical protein
MVCPFVITASDPSSGGDSPPHETVEDQTSTYKKSAFSYKRTWETLKFRGFIRNFQ